MTAGIHVAFDSLTAERLVGLGFNVVRASDNLLLGPSRRDPQEHARARRAWWGGEEEWDHLYSPDVRWEAPVIVWVSTSIIQRVNLWRTCAWLRLRGTADVRLVELDAVRPMRAFDCASSVADHSDAVLLESLTNASPWSPARYDLAIQLWNQFTDADPSPFVESCLRGVVGFPELGPLWAFLSQLFPRRAGERLQASRFDELLLTILSGEWQTPVKVFVHKSPQGAELQKLALCTGDLFIPQRLDDWTRAGAADRAPGPRPPLGYPMNSSVYRLTEKGSRLREEGLERLTDAPALPIGGTEAYGAPWVLQEDGRLVRGT